MSPVVNSVYMYIDGFNFYYGLYKPEHHGPPPAPAAHKWLDFIKLGNAICKAHGIPGTVEYVNYCTARTLGGTNNNQQAQWQDVYIRALRSFPNVHVELGLHTENPKNVRAIGANGMPYGHPYKAMVREEKGSDVNLAAFLVRDAAMNKFQTALVLSNDSNLSMTINITCSDFGKDVIVVSPHSRRHRVTRELTQVATNAFKINPALLANCLLPDQIQDSKGRLIFKSRAWN